MHAKEIVTSGKKLHEADKVLILIHGRGATAQDILGLSKELAVTDFAIMAPQATNYTWYPNSFLAPENENEPWLSSALAMLNELVSEVNDAGIKSPNIFFAGFSQGACLTLEFVTRNARLWGGVAAFTGGLIGEEIEPDKYKGDFERTPVFIGSADPDSHVPVERVQETSEVLRSMNAIVTQKIYPGMGHTITADEIALANEIIFNQSHV